jgi:hypothetical protein
MKTVLSWCFQKITSRYPGTLLILALFLSGISVYWASGLSFNPRMDNLLPQELPLIKEFNEVVAKTGGSGPLVVVLEQLNPIQAPEVIAKLARALEKVPGTYFVDSQVPEEFLRNRQLLLVPKAELLQLESLNAAALPVVFQQSQVRLSSQSFRNQPPVNSAGIEGILVAAAQDFG